MRVVPRLEYVQREARQNDPEQNDQVHKFLLLLFFIFLSLSFPWRYQYGWGLRGSRAKEVMKGPGPRKLPWAEMVVTGL